MTMNNPGDEVLLKEQEQRVSMRVESDEVWTIVSVSAGLTDEGDTEHRVVLQRFTRQAETPSG